MAGFFERFRPQPAQPEKATPAQETKIVSHTEKAPDVAEIKQAEKPKEMDEKAQKEKMRDTLTTYARLNEDLRSAENKLAIAKDAFMSLESGDKVDGWDLQRKLGATGGHVTEMGRTGDVGKFLKEEIKHFIDVSRDIQSRKDAWARKIADLGDSRTPAELDQLRTTYDSIYGKYSLDESGQKE